MSKSDSISADADWAKFNLTIHSADDAVLAYIDLCGTTDLYRQDIVPLKEQAERLFNALIDSFVNALMERFPDDSIREDFYINIYADSIMLSLRRRKPNAIKQLLIFLLYFQRLLILEHKAIPFRAIIAQDSYFALHFDSISENHILSSKFIDVSLCGGRGMISLDKKLKRLPIGVYIEEALLGFDFSRARLLAVKGEDLIFVKQNIRDVELLSSAPSGETVTIDKARYFPGCHRKWDQWFAAHEGRIKEITREDSERQGHVMNCIYKLINKFKYRPDDKRSGYPSGRQLGG